MNEVGLIGFGYWGRTLHNNLLKSEFVESIKVYSSKTTKDDSFTANIYDLINSNYLKYIFIASPSSTHFEIAEKLLISNKNVFCEKPIAFSRNEIERLFSLAIASGLKLFVDYTYTYSTSFSRLLKALKNEHIKSISVKMHQNGPFYDESVGWTLGTHVISMIDEIISLRSYIVDNVKYKKDRNGVLRHLEVHGNVDETIVYFEVSQISFKKRQLTIETKNKRFFFDMLVSPSVVISNKKGETLRSFGHSADENNNLSNAISIFFKEDLTHYHFKKSLLIYDILKIIDETTQKRF